jgi:hypothetical protein
MRPVKGIAVCTSDLVETADCKLDNLFQQLRCDSTGNRSKDSGNSP